MAPNLDFAPNPGPAFRAQRSAQAVAAIVVGGDEVDKAEQLREAELAKVKVDEARPLLVLARNGLGTGAKRPGDWREKARRLAPKGLRRLARRGREG
eukprot:5720234-Pleurochrysis_carterae.AAC.2